MSADSKLKSPVGNIQTTLIATRTGSQGNKNKMTRTELECGTAYYKGKQI